MATKKKATKKSKPRKRASKRLEKAVPPPDNPLLRFQAYDPAVINDAADEADMARMRVEAINDTREMATAEPTDATSNTDDDAASNTPASSDADDPSSDKDC